LNSIFFRIYAGMVVAVLLIGALAYGAVQLVNTYRADIYRESMARGTFYLMARGLQRHQDEEQRDRWQTVLGKLLGADVEVRDWESLGLDEQEKESLERGRVVMRLNEEQGYADIMYKLPDESSYLYTRMTKVGEQQARATALLILDELGQYPRDQWPQVLERLRDYFGFPINRVERSELRLDREQLQRLERREVVLALDDSASRSSAVNVYAPIGNTGEALVLGPLALFDRWPVEMLVMVGIAGLLAMAFATYLLVRPLQRRLRGLDRAVQELGRGNLEVRARVGGQDAVGQLASTFNGMARHIQRLIESQREMTRAVSHELRTPVARLRFGLEMLVDEADASQRLTKQEQLDHDIDQLDDLIDEILTFARLEEGTPTLEFQQVDMPRLLEQIQRELMPLSGDIVIDVDASEPPPEHRHAEGVERYLHRILQNLVTNALRYAVSQVKVRYRVVDERAILEVEDDGPGISEADRERIFKPFARLDKSRHRSSGGYGLGLSIVQRIVEWHGGDISVDRGPLGGARFRVSWPLSRAGHHVLSVNKA
jgi:two-component system sensor histidine kinase RstB